MNKKLLMLISAGILIVIVIVTAYLVIFQNDRDNSNDNTNQANSTETSNSNTSANSDAPIFSPVKTSDISYKATITGVDDDGTPYSGVFKNNGKGIAQFTTELDDDTADFYYANDTYIFCQENECYSIPSTEGGAPFDLDTFEFSESEFETYKDKSIFIETTTCPAGNCDVWSFTDEGVESKIYISKSDNRISQITSIDENENVVKIVYEYMDIEIILPENIQALPAGP